MSEETCDTLQSARRYFTCHEWLSHTLHLSGLCQDLLTLEHPLHVVDEFKGMEAKIFWVSGGQISPPFSGT